MIFKSEGANISFLGTQINQISDLISAFKALGTVHTQYSTQQVISALQTQGLTESNIQQLGSIVNLTAATTTLTREQVEQAVAEGILSQEKATAITRTLHLSYANKALAASAMKAKVLTIGLNAAIGMGIGFIITTVIPKIIELGDSLFTTAEEQKEAYSEIRNNLDETATEITKVDSELESVQTRMNELLAMPSLTVTEKDELQALQEQNKELTIRRDLLKETAAIEAQKVVASNTKTYKRDIGNYEFSNEAVNDFTQDNSDSNLSLIYDERNLNELIATYKQYLELRNNSTGEDYIAMQDAVSGLEDKMWKYAEKLSNYQQEYDAAIASGAELTEVDQGYYDNIAQGIRMVYAELKPSVLLEDVFSYEGYQDKFKELSLTPELSLNDVTVNGDYDVIVKDIASKLFGDSAEDHYQDAATILIDLVKDKSLNYIASNKISLSNLFTSDDANEKFDNFQSQIETVYDSLGKIDELSTSEITDLLQEVSSWKVDFNWEEYGVTGAKGVGNLKQALVDLAAILTEDAKGAFSDYADQIDRISNEAEMSSKGFASIGEAMSTLSNHHGLLDEIKTEVSDVGVITAESCNKILSAYPQLQGVITDYLSGLSSTSDVYAALSDAYENDLDLYYQCILQKKELDYSFYQQVYDNLPSWVQSYLDAYQKDFGNFKNLAEAKIKLQEQFLRLEEMSANSSGDSTYMHYASAKVQEEKNKVKEILDIIKDTELDVSGIKEPTFTKTDSKSSSDSKEDSIKELDWAAHSIDNLSHHIDYLDKALSNSESYKQRELYLKQLISSQGVYNDALDKQAELYKNEYLEAVKAVPRYRKLIESGSVFKVQDFVNQDDLYEAVTKAQDLYTSWRDINSAQEDANQSLKDYKNQLDENLIEHLASEIQLVQNDIDGIENTIDVDTEFHVVGDERKIINSWKKEKYEELLGLSSDMQELLQKKLLNYQDKLKNLKPETDDYYELKDKIADCQQELDGCVKSQREYNSAILSLPVEQYQKQLDLVDKHIDILNKSKEKYSNYISAVTYSIDEEIQSVTDSKEDLEDYYNNLIKPIQEQLDALQETNEERERALALQKAYYDLEKAQNNLSIKTYVEGQGFVFRPDENAIRDAQDAIDTALYDKAVSELQKQISNYEEIRDALLEDYDDELDRLNELKDAWSNIMSQIESLALINEFKLKFGDSALTRIIDGSDTSTIRNITQWVTDVQTELDSLDVEKDNLEDVIDTCQLIVDSYEDGSIDVDTAMTKIDEVVAEHTDTITALNQKHVESVIELSNEYKKSIGVFGDSEEDLAEDTEGSNNKIRNVIAIACSKIKNSYNNLSNFMSVFRKDMVNDIKDIGDAASEMAEDVANSIENANNAVSNANVGEGGGQSQQSTAATVIGGAATIIGGIATVIGSIFKHDGMESGFVARDQSEANRDSIFRSIALDDLKANEVPAVLQIGEAVLTKKQQDNVVRNMIAGVDYGMKFAQGVNKTSNVNINIPEIHVHEVQNADVLAKEITKSFKTRMMQEVRK